MDKIVDCTNTGINETIARLQRHESTSMNQASTHGSNKQADMKLTRCLDWCTSLEYIWLIDYSQMTVILFLVP